MIFTVTVISITTDNNIIMHSFSFVKINTGDDVVGKNDDGGDVGENDCDDDDYDQDDGDDDEDDCDDCDSDHLQVW